MNLIYYRSVFSIFFVLIFIQFNFAGTLVVANLKSDTITLIDTKTFKKENIKIGDSQQSFPSEPCIVGDIAYITLHNYSGATSGLFLMKLNLKTKKYELILPFKNNTCMPTEIRYHKNKLYITDERGHDKDSDLFVIDLSLLPGNKHLDVDNNPAVTKIAVGKTPAGLFINKTKNRDYISNRYSNFITIVDLKLEKETDKIKIIEGGTTQNNLYDVIYSKEFDSLFVSVLRSHKVCSYSFKQKKLAYINSEFQYPAGLACSGKNKRLFVANFRSNYISVINLEENKLLKKIIVGRNPVELTLDNLEKTLFVSNWTDGTVSIIDIQTLQVIKTIKTGKVPLGLIYTENVYLL